MRTHPGLFGSTECSWHVLGFNEPLVLNSPGFQRGSHVLVSRHLSGHARVIQVFTTALNCSYLPPTNGSLGYNERVLRFRSNEWGCRKLIRAKNPCS